MLFTFLLIYALAAILALNIFFTYQMLQLGEPDEAQLTLAAAVWPVMLCASVIVLCERIGALAPVLYRSASAAVTSRLSRLF